MVYLGFLELIPLSMVVYSFYYTSVNYHDMPEKIAVRFSKDGKPTKWVPTTRFRLYLGPVTDLITFVFIAAYDLQFLLLPTQDILLFFVSLLLLNLPIRVLFLGNNVRRVRYAVSKVSDPSKYPDIAFPVFMPFYFLPFFLLEIILGKTGDSWPYKHRDFLILITLLSVPILLIIVFVLMVVTGTLPR